MEKFERDRNKDGTLRQTRGDAHIGNVAPDIKKEYGYRRDKSVDKVLEEQRVTSLSQLRKK